jgi:hypothetical protein
LRESESPAEAEALWLRRREELLTWGSKFFDENLNELGFATEDAALEIRLVRDPERELSFPLFEMRTRLACSERLGAVVASAQRQLAERWDLRFAAAGTLRPHVITDGPRGLVRSYGEGSVFRLHDEASVQVRAYWFLADLWRVAATGNRHVRLTFMRWFAENVVAVQERWDLFAPWWGIETNDPRPSLSDELLGRIGRALGFVEDSTGLFRVPTEPVVTTEIPRSVLRLVAEELAERQGLEVDSMLRKVLEPMLRGDWNGALVLATEAEARAMRKALRDRRQAPTPDEPEK